MASSDGRKKSGVLSWVGRKLSRDEGEDGLGEAGKVNAEQLELKKEAGKGNNDGKEKKFGSKGEKDKEANAAAAREKMKDWEERMASIDDRNKTEIQSCVTRKLSREEGEDELGEGGKINEQEGELAFEGGKENSEKDGSEGKKEEKVKNTEAGEKPEDSEERMVPSSGRKVSGILSWVGRKLSRDEGEDGLGEGGKKNSDWKKEEEAKATGASGKPEDGEERMMSSTGRKKSGILSWVGRKLSRDDGEDKGKEEEVKTIGAGGKQEEGRVWRGGPRGATEVTQELVPQGSVSTLSVAPVGVDRSGDEKGR